MYGYQIIKHAPEISPSSVRKTPERLTMEALRVGEGFMIDDHDDMMRARWARACLRPRKFSIRKTPDGWFVRREE